MRIPGGAAYYAHEAAQISGITDIYVSESLDSNGRVQIWYSSPYIYAFLSNGTPYMAQVGGYRDLFYNALVDTLSALKLVGMSIDLQPAFHNLDDNITVDISVWSGTSYDELVRIRTYIYKQAMSKYRDRMGLILNANDFIDWALEAGAVGCGVTFPDGTHESYQCAPNACAPVDYLSISYPPSYVPKELSPVSTGGVGEEVI